MLPFSTVFMDQGTRITSRRHVIKRTLKFNALGLTFVYPGMLCFW